MAGLRCRQRNRFRIRSRPNRPEWEGSEPNIWRSKIPTADLDDVQICYEDSGEGEVVWWRRLPGGHAILGKSMSCRFCRGATDRSSSIVAAASLCSCPTLQELLCDQRAVAIPKCHMLDAIRSNKLNTCPFALASTSREYHCAV
jgi:hypothetical protein